MITASPAINTEITGLINLLVVDDDHSLLGLVKDIFSSIPLYTIHSATSYGEAFQLLRSGKRFHVCILDLGIYDIDNDEYILLKQYAHHCSIIILTGSRSPAKGAMCIQLGARAVIEKGADLKIFDLVEAVNINALINIVNFRYHYNSGETLSLATKILFEKKPKSVTAWADFMRISDRQLRNLWHANSGFSAKHILFLFNFLLQIFQYYTLYNFGSGEQKKDLRLFDDFDKNLNYFIKNREIFLFIIS